MRLGELSIGALISVNGKFSGRVVGCEGNGVINVVKEDGSLSLTDVQHIYPVPVSSSWLLSNGFSYFSESATYIKDIEVGNKACTLRINLLFRLKGMTYWGLKAEDENFDTIVNMQICHVHQLQAVMELIGVHLEI